MKSIQRYLYYQEQKNLEIKVKVATIPGLPSTEGQPTALNNV